MKTIAVRENISVTADGSLLHQAFTISVEYMDIHLTREEMISLLDATHTVVEWYDNEVIQHRHGHGPDQLPEKQSKRTDNPESAATARRMEPRQGYILPTT